MASRRSTGADIRAQLHRQQLQQQRVAGDPRDPTGAPCHVAANGDPSGAPCHVAGTGDPSGAPGDPTCAPRLENDEPAAGALVSTLAELNALDKVTNF